jgi:hypothetical protein
MKRYLINKLNRISKELHKDILEPIKILCVHQNNSEILAILTFSNEQVEEKQTFNSEKSLNQYIEDNKINNIINGFCFDKI